MKTYLVTGGAGFIGTNFTKFLVNKGNFKIIVLDNLTYAADISNLEKEINEKSIEFIKGDIVDFDGVNKIFEENDIDYVINFAAESHVDNSIKEPEIFIKTNVLGVQNLLNVAKTHWTIGKDNNNYPIYKEGKRFIQISTDEVYGSLTKDYETPKEIIIDNKHILTYGNKFFTEDTNINPRSPYSASKASGDMIAMSYFYTYKFPVNITRCSNNYGPYQHEEKLIPKVIKSILNDEDITVYGDGKNVRDWLYVKDHCRAIDLVLEKGEIGEIYNIGGFSEKENIDIIKIIMERIHKKDSLKLIKFVPDRLGHDKRYAINPEKISKTLGWVPSVTFEEGINKTVNYYVKRKW